MLPETPLQEMLQPGKPKLGVLSEVFSTLVTALSDPVSRSVVGRPRITLPPESEAPKPHSQPVLPRLCLLGLIGGHRRLGGIVLTCNQKGMSVPQQNETLNPI